MKLSVTSLSFVMSAIIMLDVVLASSPKNVLLKQAHLMKNKRYFLNEKIKQKSIRLRRKALSYYDDAFAQDDDYTSSSSSFDMSNFSLKFHSCASLSSFNFDNFDAEDEQGETFPYTNTQIVTYRLCPSSTCQDDSWKGCRNEYGNYAITLKDYFEAKKNYQKYWNELNQDRCEYCENCETLIKKYNEKCTYYDFCSQYKETYCRQVRAEDDELADLSKFTECTRVDLVRNREDEEEERRNREEREQNTSSGGSWFSNLFNQQSSNNEMVGRFGSYDDDSLQSSEKYGRVYLKVFCDGYLKIGVFSDDQCSEYIGDQVNIEEVTDLRLKEDSLKNEFEEKECLSCQAEDFLGSSTGETVEGCKNFYQGSAKCNSNLPSSTSNQYYNNEATCSIIEDIQKGNINADGQISNEYLTYNTTNPSPTTSPTVPSTSTTNSSVYNSNDDHDNDDGGDDDDDDDEYEEVELNNSYYAQDSTDSITGGGIRMKTDQMLYIVISCVAFVIGSVVYNSLRVNSREKDLNEDLMTNEAGVSA